MMRGITTILVLKKGGDTMKLTVMLTLVCMLLTGAAFATTYTNAIYPANGYPTVQDGGMNFFALKGVPTNGGDPMVILDSALSGLTGIYGWDPVLGNPKNFDPSEPSAFGNFLLGEGYMVTVVPNSEDPDGKWTVSYTGAVDGLGTESAVTGGTKVSGMTDMWISLPGVTGGNGGEHYIGFPFDHEILWESMLVTDGTETISVMDAVINGWIDSVWSWWDPVLQNPMVIDPSDPSLMYMKPGMMYDIVTYRPNLALIIPAGDDYIK